jgi:hypothetical protein
MAIRRISEEEFDKTALTGKGSSTSFHKAVLQLKPGEALALEKKDWQVKYSPLKIVTRIERKYGFKYERGKLPDGSGWAVKRVR